MIIDISPYKLLVDDKFKSTQFLIIDPHSIF